MLSQVFYYIDTGGITMYPLILCCLWMWGKIVFHLPLWQKSVESIVRDLEEQYGRLCQNQRRHDTELLFFLQTEAEKTNREGIDTIKVLATLAPFLGLFGTVTGMINSFQSVARFGLANSKALASGISEAMITTQFGLLIAVPGVLAVYFLRRAASRRQIIIEQKTAGLTQKRKGI